MSASKEERARARVLIGQVKDFVSDTVSCRREVLLAYFGEELPDRSQAPKPRQGCCDTCKVQCRSQRDLTEESHVLMESIRRAGQRHGMKMAIKTIRGWGPGSSAIGRKFSEAWWSELGLRLKRAGFIEDRMSSTAGFTYVALTAMGEGSLVEPSPRIVLPLTRPLSAELNSGVISIPQAPPMAAAAPAPAPAPPTTAVPMDVEAFDEMKVLPLRCGRTLPQSLMSLGESKKRSRPTPTPLQLVAASPARSPAPAPVKPTVPQVIFVQQVPPPQKRQCTHEQQPSPKLTVRSTSQQVTQAVSEARDSSGSWRRAPGSSTPWFFQFLE